MHISSGTESGISPVTSRNRFIKGVKTHRLIMSRVYTDKPAVSKQSKGNKPAQKTANRPQNPSNSPTTRTTRDFSRNPGAPVRSRMDYPAPGASRTAGSSSFGQSSHYSSAGQGRGSAQQEGQQGQTSPSSNAERRMEYRGGYSVVPPDEKRKKSIEAQARREAEQYAKYKEKQKLGPVSYVGTVGGGLTVDQARNRTVQSQAQRKPTSHEKVRYYHAEARQREDMQNQAKKMEARKQTERNEMHERDRQKQLDQDRRKKNEAFLRRFEGGQ